MKVLRLTCLDCGETYNYHMATGFYGEIHCKECNSVIHTEPVTTSQLLHRVRNWMLEKGLDSIAKEFERDFQRG